MRRFLLVALFFLFWFVSVTKAQSACSSTNIGNGWTCVTGTDSYTGQSGQNPYRLEIGSVSAHDLLVACEDANNQTGITLADSANNTWTRWPISIPSNHFAYQSIDSGNNLYSCWYVLDSNPYTGTFELQITNSVGSISDASLLQFRNSNGASKGIESSIAYTGSTTSNQGVSASGTCPCAAANQTITTTYDKDLIIGIANEAQSPDQISMSGYVPVDTSVTGGGPQGVNNQGCHISSTQVFCFAAATTQTTHGNFTWSWGDTTASDPNFSLLMAFRDGSGAPNPPENLTITVTTNIPPYQANLNWLASSVSPDDLLQAVLLNSRKAPGDSPSTFTEQLSESYSTAAWRTSAETKTTMAVRP